MEISSFFNSVNGDRGYNADHWAEYFATFIGNGIFPQPSNALQVLAGYDGLSVTVRAGKAWINGYYYHNTEEKPLPLEMSHASLRRIDRVVVRWGRSERSIVVEIKTGTPAANPIAPDVQRDADYWELGLADISVTAGAVAVTQSQILDQRPNSNICGLVMGMIQQLDPTSFFEQYTAFLEEQIAYWLGKRDDWEQQQAAWQQEQEKWMNAWRLAQAAWTDEQKEIFQGQFDELAALAESMRNHIAALETQSFTLINNDFDADWNKRGCDRTAVRQPNGDWLETVIVVATGFVLATRQSIRNPDPSDPSIKWRIVTAFNAWQSDVGG